MPIKQFKYLNSSLWCPIFRTVKCEKKGQDKEKVIASFVDRSIQVYCDETKYGVIVSTVKNVFKTHCVIRLFR